VHKGEEAKKRRGVRVKGSEGGGRGTEGAHGIRRVERERKGRRERVGRRGQSADAEKGCGSCDGGQHSDIMWHLRPQQGQSAAKSGVMGAEGSVSAGAESGREGLAGGRGWGTLPWPGAASPTLAALIIIIDSLQI
jgi:hypothetical protein